MQSHYFLAVPLPVELKRQIKKRFKNEELPFKRWVHEEDYHVTLVFLGACTDEQLSDIQQNCSTQLEKVLTFNLELSSIGTFGKKEEPRIFWIGVNEQPSLHDLRKKVSAVCEKVGFEVDKRPFTPHITIARKWVGEERYHEDIVKGKQLNKQWKVDKVILYKSVLSEEPKYKEVAVFPLSEG